MPRPTLERAPEPSLRYLELQITDACNLRCKHCYIGDANRNELSPTQVKDILKEFEQMQGLRVMLTGGEPLLHGKFDEINEILPDFLLRTVLFTNGLLLKKDIIAALTVDEIQVSIDGLEEAHDHLRGAGSYKRAMEAVRHALDAGFDVSISTMVHRGNLADFDSMERLFKEIGIKDWTVDVPCLTGRLRENNDLLVTPEEGGKYLAYGYGGGLHASDQGYGCGLHLMAVMADGKIAKCGFYHDRAVGSTGEGLRAAWTRIRPFRLSEFECNCDYLEICRGGCRYRAELLEGKGGKDRYRCKLYGTL
ncbi:MAG: radical SAM protein [Betaproteobacteria bacterium]